MNRDDIIRLAKEAAQGQPISRHLWNALTLSAWSEFLCKFAAMVEAAERDKCAAQCEADADMWEEAARQGLAGAGSKSDACTDCANAIRDLGEEQ